MIVRNGIHSIFRSRKLSVLFILLIAVLSLILSLGLGIYGTAVHTLAAFDNAFQSVGRIEYIGAEYPSETAADPYAAAAYENLDTEAISKLDGVKDVSKKNFTLGFMDGFKRFRGEIPYKDYGVLILNSLHSLEEELIAAETEDEPDFSSVCVITDAVTGKMTIYNAGEVSELRSFYFDRMNGTYTETVLENGEYITRSLTADEIPEEAVLNASNGTKQILYNGPVDLEDRELARWLYDPRDDHYDRQKYKVTEYTAIFNDALYSRTEERKILIRLRTGTLDFEPEEGRRYAVHGSFVDSETSNLVFEVREFSDDDDFPILDITDLTREELEESVFGTYAQRYRHANNYLNVHSARDVSLLEPFHQGWLSLAEGRFPDTYEENACVIDHSLADQTGLSVGDTLQLDLMKSSADDIYRFEGIAEKASFEITGILNENNEYQGEVFISRETPFDTAFFGSSLADVLFDNKTARQAEEAVRPLLEDHVRITLYDQGYENSCEPVQALRTAALVVTLIASLATLASLVLFAFLYIYRQRETVETLFSLGLSYAGIRRWMLSGVLCIVLTGSLIGSTGGILLQSLITSMSLSAASSLYASDTRYSEAVTGYIKNTTASLSNPLLTALICMVSILIASVILSFFFLRLSMRASKPAKGYKKIRIPLDGTDLNGRSVLRYGRIGFERGGSRSTAVILICFALSLLLCGFAAIDTNRREELDSLYDNTVISGSIVSLNGKYASGLLIPENLVRRFNQSGYLSSFHVSQGLNHYWMKEEIPHFANTSFGEESREAWIRKQAWLIFADSLQAAEDFFYSPAVIEWQDGYDESFLSAEYPPVNEIFHYDPKSGKRMMSQALPALIPAGRFDEEDFVNGEIEIESETGYLRLKPAGIYQASSTKPGIYLPLPIIYDLKGLYEEPAERPSYYSRETRFTTGRFTLKSARELSAFKDFLERNRYSEVNNPHYDRTTVLLHDATFLDALNTLKRHIAFMNMIYPVLMGFTILIGFLVSWLMINGRRMDFAVMKGLGAGRFKVFMIFFMEQALGALTGILPVLILSFFISSFTVIILFALSYLAGCALSIQLASKENLMVLLAEKE